MRRFFLLLLAVFSLAATCAEATNGNRLRLIYIKPGNPSFPDTQTVNFGVKTPVGFGGSPMAYKNPQLLGFSRCLAIVSETGHTSGAVTIFALDDRYMLVPKNGAGAYGSTWGAPADSPYTVVVEERLFSGGVCTATATASTQITVPILAATAHAREMTSADRGAAVNPEVTNPDGGVGLTCSSPFTNSKWQLATILNSAANIAAGDTVVLRQAGPGASGTGVYSRFNPLDCDFRIKPPAALYGAGRVTVVSEETDATVQNKSGFWWGGGIKIDTGLTGDVAIPIDFMHMTCSIISVTAVQPCLQFSTSTAGGGLGFYLNRCEDLTVTTLPGTTGLTNGGRVICATLHTNSVLDHNYIYRMGKALVTAGGSTVTWNTCEQQPNDFIDIGTDGNDVEHNFCFDWAGKSPNHGDFIQHSAAANGVTYTRDNLIAFNINVLPNVAFNQGDPPQCLFFGEHNSNPALYKSFHAHNNICITQNGNSLLIDRTDNPEVKWSTHLQILHTGLPNPSQSSLTIDKTCPPGLTSTCGGTGITLDHLLFNAYGYAALQAPPFNVTSAQAMAPSDANYASAFPLFVNSPNPGWKTRSDVAFALAPADFGACTVACAMNADETSNAGTFPLNNAGDVCWNNGTVFDATKTCAQMGTTKANQEP